jgi:ribonucleoside-diphosphate reductase alpha chain
VKNESAPLLQEADAIKLSTEYFNGDGMAADIFVKKYALRDKTNRILESTPDMMHRRLAREFARIEAKYPNPLSEEHIYEMLKGYRRVVAQGSPMSGIGNPYSIQSLSNCFVIEGPYDSYASINRADDEMTQIMKRRGGVGHDLSRIRPKDMAVSNAAGTTDGIGVFMEQYSSSTRRVAQGGRRGALMLTLDIRHPEIETFINIKRDRKLVTGANISIRMTDAFMEAVRDNTDFTLQWPVDVPVEKAKVTRVVKAKQIWDQIVDSAWDCAEPGVLFWDTVKRWTPADAYTSLGYGSISTNPCGEIVLSAYDACRLMLMNVSSYVINPFKKNAYFDFVSFEKDVIDAQRLMDDLIDLEIEAIDRILEKVHSDPEPFEDKEREINLWKKVREANVKARRTGLGITALGDAIAYLGVKYGSEESIALTEQIYRALALGAHKSSVIMAYERGAFPVHNHELEKNHPFFRRLIENSSEEINDLYYAKGRRNICLTTTAPAGSVSTQTQTTSGIEPTIFIDYLRYRKINPNDTDAKVDRVDELGDKWQQYRVYHHGVVKWMETTGETDTTKSPYFGATCNEIDWVSSVDVQAAAQKWVEHSISKTCNLPRDVSKEVVSQCYMRAWEMGCKGFTVYREGSRDAVIVSSDASKDEQKKEGIVENHAPKRPKELDCDIHQVKVAGESWTMLVGLLNGRPYEVFGGLSRLIEVPKKRKTGRLLKNGRKEGVTTYNLVLGEEDDEMKIKDVVSVFDNETHGAFTRTISLALRHGIPLQYVCEQLQKDKHSDMQSFSRVIARVLKTYIQDGTKSGQSVCDNCGAKGSLVYVDKCVNCLQCGHSKCG